ncbi:MAG: hypothetical protein V9E94_19260 [Microthrixaceae bacterium]
MSTTYFIRDACATDILKKVQAKGEAQLRGHAHRRHPLRVGVQLQRLQERGEADQRRDPHLREHVGEASRGRHAPRPGHEEHTPHRRVEGAPAEGRARQQRWPRPARHGPRATDWSRCRGRSARRPTSSPARFESKAAAESVEAYLKTRFLRFLVALRKISQDALRAVYQWVPQQEWDRSWTDEELYAKYGITEEEQAYIAEMIREMPRRDRHARR